MRPYDQPKRRNTQGHGRWNTGAEIAGVMEIVDGKITALRDFYDTVCYQQQPTWPGVAE